jgi:hypothetical protein
MTPEHNHDIGASSIKLPWLSHKKNLELLDISDAYDRQGNYNMYVNVDRPVAQEVGADIIIFDVKQLANIDSDKDYEITVGYLPWVNTVFWRRWIMITYQSVSLVQIIYIGEGFIQKSFEFS